MSAGNSKHTLANDIAMALQSDRSRELSSRGLLAAGVALAILQAPPANAVALGDLSVKSSLGQPLVATTTARLGPGESISSACVSAPALRGNDIGNPTGLTVTTLAGTTPGTYPVEIRSARPLYEPMYEIRLQVNCPGSVALTRNFVVMLNLPMTVPTVVAPTATTPAATANATSGPAPARRLQRISDPRLEPSRDVISGTSYRVRKGDTLSSIAERLGDRPAGSLWAAANWIYAANPQAFIRGNRDMIKLGTLLTLPTGAELAAGTPVPDMDQPAPAASASVTPTPVTDAPAREAAEQPRAAAETAMAAIRAENLEAELQATEAANAAMQAEIERAEARVAALVAAAASRDAAAETAVAADAGTISTPVAQQTAGPADNGLNPLLAALAGIGSGLGLALLLLGRGLLGRRRNAEEEHHATAIQPAQKFHSFDAGKTPAAAAYGGGGIEVEVNEAAPETPEPFATNGANDTDHTINEAPRVDLSAGLQPAAAGISSLLDDVDDDGALSSDNSDAQQDDGTMHTLFPPATDTDTVELPDIDLSESDSDTTELVAESQAATADDEAGDLDTINRRLQLDEDETLSATLTQALDLLEQDYEDELTASQILERDEVAAALQEEAAKDKH